MKKEKMSFTGTSRTSSVMMFVDGVDAAMISRYLLNTTGRAWAGN